ncbi:MAG: alkaline phosphatase [Dokdonella sp.]
MPRPNASSIAIAAVICSVTVGCAAVPPVPSRPAASRPIAVATVAHPRGETPEWWFRNGAAAAVKAGANSAGKPRNVIVFLGDGMSITTIAAARILEGQRKGESGEENRLAFEDFPYPALSRTYNVDAQTPDSAGTMTAIMTGVKVRLGSINVNQRASRGSCAAAHDNETVSLLELAAASGMATGVVTTTRITHATPAATYAHASERQWENDTKLSAVAIAEGCTDIARQLIEFPIAGGPNVAFGGGRGNFLPTGVADPIDKNEQGVRRDGRDLTAEWAARPGASYIWNPQQLAALDPARSEHVLGLFAWSNLDYDFERRLHPGSQPSLAEMTRAAIGLLEKRGQGYFLVVEGGQIDVAHHAGNAFRALDETIAFSDAVRTADQLTSDQDTLILVTADHSHVLTMASYPSRGNPILGLLRGINPDDEGEPVLVKDLDGKPFTTLNYATGPGFSAASDQQQEGPKQFPHRPKSAAARGPRPDLTDIDTTAPNYLQEAAIPLRSETHSGEDVAVFARGPGAAAVHGSLEQNVLFHLIAQSQPRIRAQLCKIGSCNANGIPVELPALEALRKAIR